ncbi:MAG: hypothetical protein Q8K60_06585, partial [Parachlamydiaceae bacterium]|nr:hypothetical protein [Parachlamydiaceae bacterium]
MPSNNSFNYSDPSIKNLSNLDFNTVELKNDKTIVLKKTYIGHVYQILTGKSLLGHQIDTKMIKSSLEQAFKNLQNPFIDKITNSNKEEVFEQIKHEFTHYKKLYEKILGCSAENKQLLESLEKELILTLKLAPIINEFLSINQSLIPEYKNKLDDFETTLTNQQKIVGLLPQDFITNLKISNSEDFISPLTIQEEAFIRNYLNHSPEYIKQKAHFEMIQKGTEDFIKQTANSEKLQSINLNGEEFNYYDLDKQEYKFIGFAGDFQQTINDYQGFIQGKWPFLCSSIINESQAYFSESRTTIFQIFSVSPEAIVHTSPIDLVSPWSQLEEQPKWYAMAQRTLVLTDFTHRTLERLK